MTDTFLATLSPMLVMFLCLLVGFVLRKTKSAPENSASVLSKLELNVFLPAQVLYTFITNCTVESIASQYKTVLYSCAAMVFALCIGIPLAKLFSRDKYQRKIYQYGLIFANFGFLGNAIVPQIMGEAGLYAYMLFTLPINVVLYGWAINTLVPEGQGKKKSLLRSFLNPTFVALIVGMVLGLLGAGQWLPEFALTATKNLSGCMGPVAMILTGFVIGGYHIPSLLKNKRVYLMTLLRLFILPAAHLGLLWLLKADAMTMKVALFAFASALGLNTVVIPAAYDGDTTTGASMAMISHVCCVVTIPVLYALLLQII